MNLDNLKSEYIANIYKTKALLIKEQPFTLQSGKKSHIYLNHRNFLSHHSYLSLIAKTYYVLAENIKTDYMLGAVDSIMSPIIVGAMSTLFNKDYIVTRRTPLTHGTQEYIYGEIKTNVVLIDDMTSTGDTLIDAAEKIRGRGGVVKYAIISAYRENTAIENLLKKDIQTLSIASFAYVIKSLEQTLSPQEKAIVTQYPIIFD